ncbi:MAG: murein L,D-transpeptidase YcbB/YkuD [Alteromonas macleodii]|jgi:murein L,D-transpeptidase YcbB/YkuD
MFMGDLMLITNRLIQCKFSFFWLFLAFFLMPQTIAAQTTAFRQAVAEAAAGEASLVEFYRARKFEGIWTGATEIDRLRRNALLAAFAGAGDHGLPLSEYDPETLMTRLQTVRTPAEKGTIEVEMSRLFLSYASDIQTGILSPRTVVPEIRREVQLRPLLEYLKDFLSGAPAPFLASLPPSSPEYARLLREKISLERLLAQGGWGPSVLSGSLAIGASGAGVVDLRDRLLAMGYMDRSATQTYDSTIQVAVRLFQQAHGLSEDGVAGSGTISELNVSVTSRLQQIIVAMERERWMNSPRGERHIWVNLVDFSAAIIDNDRITFQTRSVIGATSGNRQTPEFSDVMEFMVINPSWYVPRSIVVNEYLPALQIDPNAVNHIEITDQNGLIIDRNNVNFSQFNSNTFPFSMRQPPSRGNALGLVKFIFPNQYNIYLHDTPAKSLFGREIRAFSHGCVRLNDPFDFAHTLLAVQETDPEGVFQRSLQTGREVRIDLVESVPVHLVYRTAFTHTTGQLNFRRDIYNRDSRIWNALANEGVAVRAIGG